MKIVFIVSRFPFPLEKGDKLRAFQQLKNLSEAGHEIHLIALSDTEVTTDSLNKIKAFCKSVTIHHLSVMNIFFNLVASFSRKLPLQVGYFYSKSIHQKIDREISALKPDVIYCQLIRTASYVKNNSTVPLMIDYQDAFSKGTLQRMQNATWMLQPVYKREYRLVCDFEKNSYDWFNAHFIISDQDREALNVESSKKITILPNGIDTDYFKPSMVSKKYDITFVGNMNYPPNVDGASLLVEEIMPLVWSELPEVTVQIGGANPNQRVKKLASSKVTVTGWMDDIRECYRNTRVFIAPMRIGTGLQNKLLEAMAMKIPCITTPLSFEPLKATRDVDILVGSSAKELSGHLVKLLTDENFSNRIATTGYEFILKNYSMHHSQKLLNDVLEETVSEYRRR